MKYFTTVILTICLFTGCTTTENSPQVPTKAADVSPLLIGSDIPDISLPSPLNESVKLTETMENGALIVFYRGGWCPFCSAELADLAKIDVQLHSKGVEIVAISPDSPEFLQQSIADEDLGYTLLSDSKMEAARAFGVAFRVDIETVQSLKKNGMDIEERSGETHHLLPVPSLFLVNPEGKIVFQYVNPDYRQRVDKSIIMAAVNSMIEE